MISERTTPRGFATAVYTALDFEGAKRWYADLLGIEPYHQRDEYAEFRFGDNQDELGIINAAALPQLGGEAPTASGPAGVLLYWHVDDIAGTVERLVAKGATLHQPPMDFGEGFVGASVIDPFGNIFGIMHNPHYLARRAQPAA